MISEVSFSKKFTSFWNEVLPNAKNYIRLVNSAVAIRVHPPLASSERKQNVALVNVIAFSIYRESLRLRVSVDSIFTPSYFTSPEFEDVVKHSITYLKRFGSYQPYELPFLMSEFGQIRAIAVFLGKRYGWPNIVEVDPVFDGCGYINPCVGDIVYGSKLVEIKSGERAFSVTDLRQVLVYCMLNHYSNNRRGLDAIEIYNPRLGLLFSQNIDELADDLSALSAIELFAELQKFVVDNAFVEI